MKYLLTGRTGSGLSTAKRAFERSGFLISYPRLSNFQLQDYDDNHKHLIVIDVNTAIVDKQDEQQLVQYYQNFYVELKKQFTIICLNADETQLFRRQQRDQIPPLYCKLFNVTWIQAFGMKSKVLVPFYENANFIFDTSTSQCSELAQSIDLFIHLKMDNHIKISSYHNLLSYLYHENFWDNIGNNMSVFCEIAEQPQVAKRFIENFPNQICSPLEQKNIQDCIKQVDRIVLTGMGSSFYSCEAAKECLQKCYNATLPLDCIPLSELSFGNLQNVLVIINSNSGETGEIKECFARDLFAQCAGVFGITNHPNSFLGKKCCENNKGLLFSMNSVEEVSIAATATVTANILNLIGIAAVMEKTRTAESTIVDTLMVDLIELPKILKNLLTQGSMNQIFSWSQKMAEHFKTGTGFVIGCGALTSILPEVALKGIELARLHLSSLKHSFAHGPLNIATLEAAIYLQDTLTSKKVITQHLEKLVQHCPIFAIGPYWDIDLPNLYTFACSSKNAILNIFAQLMVMQLAYPVFALIKGLSVNEICHPSMLQKVVLASPIS